MFCLNMQKQAGHAQAKVTKKNPQVLFIIWVTNNLLNDNFGRILFGYKKNKTFNSYLTLSM